MTVVVQEAVQRSKELEVSHSKALHAVSEDLKTMTGVNMGHPSEPSIILARSS